MCYGKELSQKVYVCMMLLHTQLHHDDPIYAVTLKLIRNNGNMAETVNKIRTTV